jgi:methionyl aminopeptidase
MAIIIKSQRDIQAMRDSAAINVEALQAVNDAIRPGVTTAELDRIAYDIITGHGATPAFLGYPPGSKHPYPATLNTSVNEELVHGIPGKRELREGDIVSIDCGTVYKGFVSDSAFTAPVGEVSEEAKRLLQVTEEALYRGIAAAVVGNRFGDISHTIQVFVESHGYNVVREYGGHGVGRNMHEDPHIPNWGQPGRGRRLRPGMTFAIEPMVMLGSPAVRVLDDRWTVVTVDGRLCAHFEHTIAVTEDGPEILTKWT